MLFIQKTQSYTVEWKTYIFVLPVSERRGPTTGCNCLSTFSTSSSKEVHLRTSIWT